MKNYATQLLTTQIVTEQNLWCVGVLSSLLADIRGQTPGGPSPTEHADDSKIWSLRVLLEGSPRPGPRDGEAPASAWWHAGSWEPWNMCSISSARFWKVLTAKLFYFFYLFSWIQDLKGSDLTWTAATWRAIYRVEDLHTDSRVTSSGHLIRLVSTQLQQSLSQ